MKREKTISLCMIVKNEEKHLARCLSSVKDIVDEMIIVDTGSTDNTIEIAKSFNALIYQYEWDNNFSNARNFSLSFATKEWIMLMDADDEFSKKDEEKFINLINTSNSHGHYFKTLSYAGERPGNDIVSNLNLRLLRNINKYKFVGAIHEQISFIDGVIDYKNFTTENINIFHYGYLNSVASEKNKRQRNISIIEKELSKDADNTFHLFNLGNEYSAMGNYEKAFELFNKAYKKLDFNSGFAPKLVIRRIIALEQLGKDKEALDSIEEGLSKYPRYTDVEFMRGLIHLKNKRYTLSIDSFKKCILLGEPPFRLEFFEGCGTYRPYQALGEIYFSLEDYDNSLIFFKKALQANPNLHNILYKMGSIFNKKYENKVIVSYSLSEYMDLKNISHLILISDILMKEYLYEEALKYIDIVLDINKNNNEANYLKGKALFYKKYYTQSKEHFYKVSENSPIYKDTLKYLFICSLLENPHLSIFDKLKNTNDSLLYKTYLQIYNAHKKIEEIVLTEKDDHEKALQITIDILGELLIIHEFNVFESLLAALNTIDSNNILLELGKLYYNKGFKSMAINEILRSIKEFNTIDQDCAEILFKTIK